jgi:hypothetical protein
MGVGQIYYVILIPENDKNPSPPPLPRKRPGNYWFSTFYGPKTDVNYETAYPLSTAFSLFLRFISRPETLAPIVSSRRLRTEREQRGPERLSIVPNYDPRPEGIPFRNLQLAPGNTPSATSTRSVTKSRSKGHSILPFRLYRRPSPHSSHGSAPVLAEGIRRSRKGVEPE